MESYFEVNVSYLGRHWFATAPRSLRALAPDHAETVFNDIRRKFPPEDGYTVTCTRWDITGKEVRFE